MGAEQEHQPEMGLLVGAVQERQPEMGALVGAVQEHRQVGEHAPQLPILFSPTEAIRGRLARSAPPIRMGQRILLFQEILLAIYRQVNSYQAVVMIKSYLVARSVTETAKEAILGLVETSGEAVRLLHLSLWTATQKTLHISLPGDLGQIDQEVTEVDSNADKEEGSNAEWHQKIPILIHLKVLVVLQIIQL